jgi:DNA topoisomerase-1
VLAGIFAILASCFLRPGSEDYADQNGSFGVATLRRRHVTVKGDRVRFDFEGKAGKRQQHEIRDRRVARLVRELLRYPGEVFKFENGDQQMVDVRRKHINLYIKEVMGAPFSAKDFRTWAANLLCASALARLAPRCEPTRRARSRQVAIALREVAAHLGNTPAVCRASYVFDTVFRSWERGRVVSDYIEKVEPLGDGRLRALERSERALLGLLRPRAA